MHRGQFSPAILLVGVLFVPLVAGCAGRLDSDIMPRDSGAGTGGGNGSTGGSPGGDGTGGAPPPCDAPTLWFANTDFSAGGCAFAGACHDAASVNAGIGGINLVDADVWHRLLNQPSTKGVGSSCMGMTLVNPTKPPSGILIKRISEIDPCGKSSLMPLGAAAPNQDIVNCIVGWVNDQLSK